mmetsp:Transcript_77000/g.146525  ORF Transcript_77000/g.146525 Transcript_77000/m.146525 type:complete len:229 (-) Transcript_77000:227-913(-)
MGMLSLLACLLCVGHSRRVQQASLPTAAFMPSGSGARMPAGDASRGTSRPAMQAEAKPFNIKELAGITEPVGFFDPFGLSEGVSEGRLRFYREVELKHGRLGMLAALGFLVAEQYHPLFGGDIDVPSYLAFQQTPLEKFWALVVSAISVNEVYSVFTFNNPVGGEPWSIRSDHEPGNLLFDPLKLRPEDPEEWLAMQNKELNNGRLAMLAAAGMIAQELVTGNKLFTF